MQENTPYAIGWGTLSLINAGLAQAKGRSGLLWWVLSLCLLIVVFPPVTVAADQDEGPHPSR